MERGNALPLIRGHVRFGALVCGVPARASRFGTADFPMLVAVDNVKRRFARHFDLSPDLTA